MKLNKLKSAVMAKPAAKSKPTSKVKAISSPKTEKEWQIQDDVRTLQRAMEVKSDPKRLQAAKEYATKEMEALKQVSKM